MISVIRLRNLENFVRLLIPYLFLVLLVVLSVIKLPVPQIGEVKPYLVLMAIYYWSIYRPTLIPPLSCFLIGLIIDILSGVPLGLNAFILVGTHWIVRDQRRFLTGQPYITIWAGFGLVAIASCAWQWGLIGLIKLNWGSAVPGLITVVLSLFMFPFITLLLNLTHRLLPIASRP
jgi:rod shape-determining protein MreD